MFLGARPRGAGSQNAANGGSRRRVIWAIPDDIDLLPNAYKRWNRRASLITVNQLADRFWLFSRFFLPTAFFTVE